MKKTKRLFLFAGYDKDGIIDDTLVHYLTELSKLGDIVLVMDCDVADTTKLSGIKNILHTELARHNEYDFGSYKRGYIWAHDNKILDKYDWVYLVNDSVYGPLFDLEPVLCDLESRGVDLIGLTSYQDINTPVHIQSYFVGVSKKIITTQILYDFLKAVQQKDNKFDIVYCYEVGLSVKIISKGFKLTAFFDQCGDDGCMVYDHPLTVLKQGIPFVKKTALPNTLASHFLLPYAKVCFIESMYSHAMRNGIDLTLPITTNGYRNKYEKFYRFSLLSIPIFSIYRKNQTDCNLLSYKLYVFDKIPVLKIMVKK